MERRTEHAGSEKEDTVEVVVFDPHEAHSSVSEDRRQSALLLFVHQKGHEVLDLRHVHITAVIPTHQDLKEKTYGRSCQR